MKNPIFLQKPSCNSCSPGKLGQSEYLSTKNFLSEFDTEEKRLTVLRNLGILNNQIDVVQELGDDTHAVMSQKAVTDAINNNKNIEIYESENNLPTSAETGRIAAVVYQTNNETISRLYFKNSQEWKSINDLTIVDSENKLDPSAPQGTIAVVAVNSKQSYLSNLVHPRVLKSQEDFEQLELIKTDFVINAPVSTDLDLSEELITLTFAQDYYVPKYSTSGEIQPNLPHYIYLGKFDTLKSEEAAWGIYHFSQTHGGGVIAEYDKQGNRIVYNKEAIYDLNLYIVYKNFYKYWTSYEIAPNYDIVNNFIALGQNVMTTVPYIKDVEGWTSLLSSDILYIDSDKLAEFDLEEQDQEVRITVPKDRLFEVTGGVKFEDFKNYSRICINNSIYPLLLEDGIYRTPITSILEDNVFVQILPVSIQGYNDNYYFSTSVINQELNDVKIGDDFYNLPNSAITGSIGTIQEYSDTCTLTEFYDNYHDSFPEKIQGVSIITPKYSDFNHADIFNTFKNKSVTLETYIYNIYDGKPVSMASAGPSLVIGKLSGSDETVAWGIYYFSKAIVEYDYDGNQVTYDEEVLTKFNDDLHPGNTGGKVAGGYISYPKEFEIFNEIIALQHYQSRTALVVKNERGWSRYTSPILDKSIKEEHLSNELKDSLKGVTIYTSEDQLPVQSEPGNIATVVKNETQYVNLSALYQFEDSDFNNQHVDYVADISALKEKGTRVSNIQCLIPKNFDELASWLNNYFQESSYIGLVNLNASNANDIQYYDVYVGLSGDEEPVYYMSADLCDPNVESYEKAVFWSCEGPDSPIMVDEESIRDFNNTLAQGEWVYCNQPGYTNLELHDKFIKVAQEVKSTSLHLKTLESWERINDVKIVDSVDKLDPNAPQGTLATVAINTFRKIKWSEVYQPTEEELNQPFEEIVGKLTRISKFEVTPPESMDIMPSEGDWYMLNFGSENSGGVFSISRYGVQCMINGFDEDMMWASLDDGGNYNWEVYRNFVQQANELLSKDSMYYIGSFLNDESTSLPSFLEDILHIYTGEVSTELYIKTDKGWTPYKESDTVYIDYNALDEYDRVDLYEENYWYYEIPINEFPKVSQGVAFDKLSKYKRISFDGQVEPLMNDGYNYYTPQYIYGEDEIWYGRMLEIFVDGEYVYVGDYIEYKVDTSGRIYNNVNELPSDASVGSTAMVKSQTEVPVVKNIPKSGKLRNITLVPNAGTLSFPTSQNTQFQIYTGGPESLPGSLKTINLRSNGYPSNFTLGLKLPSSSGDVASWDSEGKLSVLDQSAIDAFNDMLNTDEYVVYSTGLSDYAYNYLSQLIKTNGTKLVSAMYVKEDSWEEYKALKEQSVTTEKVADNAITTDKVEDGAITTEKVADGTITMEKLAEEVQEAIAAGGAGGTGSLADILYSVIFYIETAGSNPLPAVGQTNSNLRVLNTYKKQIKDYLDEIANYSFSMTNLDGRSVVKSMQFIWKKYEQGEFIILPVEELKKAGDIYSFSVLSISDNCRYRFTFNGSDILTNFITVSAESLSLGSNS